MKEKSFNNIEKKLNSNKELITGCTNYYNENVNYYNKLYNSFPSNIIAKLFKYKEKDYLDDDKEEPLKILNEE